MGIKTAIVSTRIPSPALGERYFECGKSHPMRQLERCRLKRPKQSRCILASTADAGDWGRPGSSARRVLPKPKGADGEGGPAQHAEPAPVGFPLDNRFRLLGRVAPPALPRLAEGNP